MAIKTQQERYEELLASYQPQITAEKAAAGEIYDAEKKQTEQTYLSEMEKTARSYDTKERENAVQRLVNEHQIRTGMEAAGLSDSGLNRTQQTAVQLSYANNKAQIGQVRQQALDQLTLSLADSLAKIEREKSSAFADIDAAYRKTAASGAVDLYEADLKAETERQKLENERIKAQTQQMTAYNKLIQQQTKNQSGGSSAIIKTNDGLLSYDFKGTLQDNGVAIYYLTDKNLNLKTKYVDQNSGKSTTVDRWVNPFTTALPNADLFDSEGQYDPNKAFSNGYQPNNIGGKKLTKVGTIDLTEQLGRTQNVYQTTKGKYWVWSGKTNQYVKAVKKGSAWVIA